jgi:hypothetical protein
MELDQRVEALERKVAALEEEIRETLLDVQESLSKKPAGPSPARWQKKAWVLALLNLLLAIVLFTNIRLYTPEPSLEGNPLLSSWLHALWVALAFVWLILQMYPLGLLLDQEDSQSRKMAGRNAVALFKSNPRLTLIATMSALVMAVVSALFPSLWLVVMAILAITLCANGVGFVLGLWRRRLRWMKGEGRSER